MPWNCELCGESFEKGEDLVEHLRKKHRDKIKTLVLEHPERPEGKGEAK